VSAALVVLGHARRHAVSPVRVSVAAATMNGGRHVRMMGLLWWIDRWRTSAAFREMTLEEQGAYRNLLDEAYLNGGVLPNDDRLLAKACGDATRWPAVRDRVLAKFTLTPSGWHNETLTTVFRMANGRAERQRRYRAANGRA
jgi:uncharacterized protein YdaU (DUF1376 family)